MSRDDDVGKTLGTWLGKAKKIGQPPGRVRWQVTFNRPEQVRGMARRRRWPHATELQDPAQHQKAYQGDRQCATTSPSRPCGGGVLQGRTTNVKPTATAGTKEQQGPLRSPSRRLVLFPPAIENGAGVRAIALQGDKIQDPLAEIIAAVENLPMPNKTKVRLLIEGLADRSNTGLMEVIGNSSGLPETQMAR